MNEEGKRPYIPNFFTPVLQNLDKGPTCIPCSIRGVSCPTRVRQGKMKSPVIIDLGWVRDQSFSLLFPSIIFYSYIFSWGKWPSVSLSSYSSFPFSLELSKTCQVCWSKRWMLTHLTLSLLPIDLAWVPDCVDCAALWEFPVGLCM